MARLLIPVPWNLVHVGEVDQTGKAVEWGVQLAVRFMRAARPRGERLEVTQCTEAPGTKGVALVTSREYVKMTLRSRRSQALIAMTFVVLTVGLASSRAATAHEPAMPSNQCQLPPSERNGGWACPNTQP